MDDRDYEAMNKHNYGNDFIADVSHSKFVDEKQKAKELVEKFLSVEMVLTISDLPYMELSKKCAIILVDEILEECLQIKVEFWEQVRCEIQSYNK